MTITVKLGNAVDHAFNYVSDTGRKRGVVADVFRFTVKADAETPWSMLNLSSESPLLDDGKYSQITNVDATTWNVHVTEGRVASFAVGTYFYRVEVVKGNGDAVVLDSGDFEVTA